MLNSGVNSVSKFLGKGKISLSKKIKDSVKRAVKYINDFERTAAEIAIENNHDYVICGHIHQPKKKEYKNQKGRTIYLNSGDWVENLTALEYHKKKWTVYKYNEEDYENVSKNFVVSDITEKTDKEIFNELLSEFNLLNHK